MSLERAIDDQRLMDQIYASLEHARAVTEHYDIVIIGSGAGGGTMAHALSASAGADSRSSSAATSCRRRTRTGIRKRSGSTSAIATTERWLDERGRGVPAVHALLRRRQHASSGAACSTGCGARTSRRSSTSTASRRRGRSTTTRSSRIYERAERLYHVHGQAGRRSDGAAARAVPVRARSALGRNGGDRREAAAPGAASLAAAARAPASRGARRLHPLQHLQLVPLQAPREERRRRLLHPAGAPAAERHAVDECLRPPSGHRSVGRKVDGGRSRAGRRDAPRRARRCSSCRAAPSTRRRCCCGRRTPRIPTAWRTPRGSSGGATWRTWRR